VLRADVAGSIEAIRHELRKVTHERALLRVVAAQVGAVTETDIKTAHAIGGVVVAFHTSVEATAADLALRLSVPIESFDIIYDLEKRLQELLNSRAPRMKKEEALGEAKILKLFNTSGTKQVMGGELLSGTLMVGNQVKITRRDIELGYGKITNLQQARMDVKALTLEGEFGMQIESKVDIGQGDRITAFKVVEI
jgi:translation initiation factor IF-2